MRKKKRRRWAGVSAGVALVVFAAIQLVPVERSNPGVRSEVDAPAEVAALLRRACYDCHSYETSWPWYSRVAPVSWWIADHVRDARADLDFSNWPRFDFEAQALTFQDIRHQVSSGEMPLSSYTWLHPEARLTEAERERIVRWAAEGAALAPPM